MMTPPPHYAVSFQPALVAVAGPTGAASCRACSPRTSRRSRRARLRFAALLTPQGGCCSTCSCSAGGRRLPAGLRPPSGATPLSRRLSIYRLRAKVEIAAEAGEVMALWRRRRHRRARAGSPTRGCPPSACAATEPRRRPARRGPRRPPTTPIVWRWACPTRPATRPARPPIRSRRTSTCWPASISSKGCFVGQETTSRMKRRGPIKTRMAPIAFDGPPPAFGAEVLAGTLRAGQVLTGEDGRAMALLRLDRLGTNAPREGGSWRPVPPPAWRRAWAMRLKAGVHDVVVERHLGLGAGLHRPGTSARHHCPRRSTPRTPRAETVAFPDLVRAAGRSGSHPASFEFGEGQSRTWSSCRSPR